MFIINKKNLIIILIVILLLVLLLTKLNSKFGETVPEKTFTKIYETNEWGEGGNDGTKSYKGSSGDGSLIDKVKDTYIPFLQQFIIAKNIKSIVDLGCGDFQTGKLIYDKLDVKYTGYDTYEKVIDYNKGIFSPPKYSFIFLDFYTKKEQIISADLCILKDVIQHWPLEAIYTFLDYLVSSKKFKYILLTNCSFQTEDNTDIKFGQFRPLSVNYFPLKYYNPVKLYSYDTKEVSLIDLT
jgi:SAM-dependent methyltransferase